MLTLFFLDVSFENSSLKANSNPIVLILEKIRKMEETKMSQCMIFIISSLFWNSILIFFLGEDGVIVIRGQQYNFFGDSSTDFVLFNESAKSFWIKQSIFSLLTEIKKRFKLNSDISLVVPPLDLKFSMDIYYSKIISLGHIWGLHNSLFYPNQFYSVIEEESLNFESKLEKLINLSQNIASASVSDGYESEDEIDYDDLLHIDEISSEKNDLFDKSEDGILLFSDSKRLDKKINSSIGDTQVESENQSFSHDKLELLTKPESRKLFTIDIDEYQKNSQNSLEMVQYECLNDFQMESNKEFDTLSNLKTTEEIKFSSKKRLTNECAEAYDNAFSKRKKFSDEDSKITVKADGSN